MMPLYRPRVASFRRKVTSRLNRTRFVGGAPRGAAGDPSGSWTKVLPGDPTQALRWDGIFGIPGDIVRNRVPRRRERRSGSI